MFTFQKQSSSMDCSIYLNPIYNNKDLPGNFIYWKARCSEVF